MSVATTKVAPIAAYPASSSEPTQALAAPGTTAPTAAVLSGSTRTSVAAAVESPGGSNPNGVSVPVYGLDIETDTALGGLDPQRAPIVAVAVAGPEETLVFGGASHHTEAELLASLDAYIAALEPGVLVTWNGARFDLPFLADRAETCEVRLGLQLVADRRTRTHRDPLPGHEGGYFARWHQHRHLDAYAVYRADVGASLGIPCGLKPLSRLFGLEPVEVDRENIHDLSPLELDAYVASDAVLTRELALRRWATAVHAVDVLPH